MSTGALEILNVQQGEVRLTFDTNNCAEAMRARRMITEMIRIGFVLVVQVDGRHERVIEFDERSGEYIIADFTAPPTTQPRLPPVAAAVYDTPTNGTVKALGTPKTPTRGRPRKRIPIEQAEATAVGPSAGG